MKNICKNSLTGRCRYGKQCRFVHPTTTKLLDPPSWIYTGVEGLDTTEISSDEVRYSLLVGDTTKILDDIWIDNYSKMYRELNGICRSGVGRSTSSRCVDLRKHPEIFNLPFDLSRVEKKIVELRRNSPIVGEGDVMEGTESEQEEIYLEGENIPKFIKEYKEKKGDSGVSSRDSSSRNRIDSRPHDTKYNSNRPHDTKYDSRPQDSRDSRPHGYKSSYDSRTTGYNRNSYDNRYDSRQYDNRYDSRQYDNRYDSRQYENRSYDSRRHYSTPPHNRQSTGGSYSTPRDSNFNRDNTFSHRDSYPPSHSSSHRKPSSPKDKEDFEYKNIPYNFDRK